jgi:D-glucuronyl C5-epimerase-like protein
MPWRPTSSRPARLLPVIVLVVAYLSTAAAAAAGTHLPCPVYRPDGPYPLAEEPGVERVLEQPGVTAWHGLPLRTDSASGLRYRNIDDVAFYGLEGWTHWRRTRQRSGLAQARRAGDWLVAHQPAGGGWRYPIAFSLAGLGIEQTLRPGWVAAQAEGDSISLLVRLYRATSRSTYLRAARRALGPYERPPARHGFRAVFRHHVFYDGFPSSPPSLVLEDFQISLIGAADLAPLDATAARLFDRGLGSLYWALPLLDDGEGKPLYGLTYLTAPGAPRIYEAPAHTVNALLLCELARMRPSPAATRYAARWQASNPHAYYRYGAPAREASSRPGRGARRAARGPTSIPRAGSPLAPLPGSMRRSSSWPSRGSPRRWSRRCR